MKIGGKEIKLRPGAWILLPALILAWINPNDVRADVQPGLAVTIYDNFGYNGSPPLPSVSGRPVQCTTSYLDINQDFGNSICGLYDDYIVKYEGYITSPTTETITFYPSADDGTKLYIDNVLVDNNWVDKGGGGNPSTPIDFTAGVPKSITLWFYENGGGNWVELAWNQGGGYSIVPAEAFTQNNESQYTTTTTLAPYFNSPQNLTATSNQDGSVDLDWDAPEASNLDIYAYGVTFYDLDEIGGTTSSGWGVWTNQGTTYSLAEYMFSGTTGFGPVRFGIKAGNESCFSAEGVGPCVYGPEVNVDVIVIDPTPPTTTTTEPESTTTELETTTSENTTTTTEVIQEPEITTTIPLPNTGTTSSTVGETTTTMETVPETIPITEEENVGPGDFTESTVQDSLPEPETVPQDETPTQETTPELSLDTSEEIDQINTAALSSEELGAAISDILDKPLTDEQFTAVLETIFNESLSDEQFDAAISSVLDSDLSAEQFTEVIGILEGDSVTEEQVSSAVDSIIENGITEDQATELATSEKVLESISADAAAEIFNEIPVDELSDEQGQQIVEAVQNAPTEIKEAFEEEINVFDGAFDTYVPTDSSISVGERRTVVAVTVVSSVIAVSAAAAPSSGPSSPGSGGSSGGGGGAPSGGSSDGGKPRRRRGG